VESSIDRAPCYLQSSVQHHFCFPNRCAENQPDLRQKRASPGEAGRKSCRKANDSGLAEPFVPAASARAGEQWPHIPFLVDVSSSEMPTWP